MKLKIAHFSIDNQFIESSQFTFSKIYPNSENQFFIYKGLFKNTLKKSKNIKNIKRIYYHQAYFIGDKDLKKFDLVIFHSMNYWNSLIASKLKKIQFLNIIWGGEIYTNSQIKTEYSLINHDHLKKTGFLKKLYDFFQYGYISTYDDRCKIIKKSIFNSKYISCNHLEFQYLKKIKVINKHSDYINLTYYPIEFLKIHFPDKTTNKNLLMIGKSANIAENNISILNMIGQNEEILSLNKVDIYMNLSYGNKYEIRRIKKKLSSFKNISYKTQKQFLELVDYYKVLNSVRFFVFNSTRQQGVGNILSLLYLGAKIYLNKNNLLYEYYKKLGFNVFTVEEFNKALKNKILIGLDKEEINNNKKLIEDNFSLKSNKLELSKLCLKSL